MYYTYVDVPTFGSWTKAPPLLLPGGITPVVMYFSASITV